MYTIKNEVRTIYEINKSRFITSIKPVKSIEEAKSFFLDIKKEFAEATHNVTAYIIGKTGEFGHYSDDGEPNGTAGLPILDVFKKNEITNFACVVTRYFGGIKLGAGGLVRAYSTATSLALKEAQICEIIEYIILEIEFNYPYLDIIENRLKNIEIISKEFSTNVKLIIKIPQNSFEEIKNMLIYITNNMVKIKIK